MQAGDVDGTRQRSNRPLHPGVSSAGLNTPVLTTQCAAGTFTYQGQPFGYTTAPVITATAVSVGGSTTTNYAGTFFKMTNTTLTGRTYSAASTLNVAGLPRDDRRPRDSQLERRRRDADVQRRHRHLVRQEHPRGAVQRAGAARDQRRG